MEWERIKKYDYIVVSVSSEYAKRFDMCDLDDDSHTTACGQRIYPIRAADPVPIYLAIPGLLCVSALLLYYAARKIRPIEISYGTD